MRWLVYLLAFVVSTVSKAHVCKDWIQPQVLGKLNHKMIGEASGMAISKKYDNRIYHINDSGDGPYFYQTDFSGKATKRIEVANFNPNDVEDLGYGPCGNELCLIIADIGDNAKKRKEIRLVYIAEREKYGPQPVQPEKILRLKYPDHPHDAEGLVAHPNGDVFIITKEASYKGAKARPAQVYRLPSNAKANGPISLDHVGELDVPALMRQASFLGQIVTAADIGAKGTKLLLLTYEAALELSIDLAQQPLSDLKSLKAEKDFVILKLNQLPQQEAISYLPDQHGFIYNTEYHKAHGSAPMIKFSCKPSTH